jgi:hypothetical protein
MASRQNERGKKSGIFRFLFFLISLSFHDPTRPSRHTQGEAG